MAQTQPTRAFIPFTCGHLHIRYAGSGPPLILLHECPRSSLSVLPLLEQLSSHYCCIALDTPGYGDSDPIVASPGTATIEDFVGALRQLLDRLQLEQVYLYGIHTGAAIAAEFGRHHPARVKHLFLDAPPAFTAPEQQSMLTHYLTPIVPERDGSHLNAVWTRVLDQQTYFPFYDRRPQTRLTAVRRDLEFVHRTAMGFLAAGDDYPTAYRAAILYPMAGVLSELADIPFTLFGRHDDLLVAHMQRLPVAGTVLQGLQDIARLMRQPLANNRLATVTAAELTSRQCARRRYLKLSTTSVYIEMPAQFNGRMTLRSPFINRGAASDAATASAAIDLPGFGLSDLNLAMPTDTETCQQLFLNTATAAAKALGANLAPVSPGTDWLRLLLSQLGILPDDWNIDGSINSRHTSRLPLPNLRLDWSGAHLLAAWTAARDIAESLSTDTDDAPTTLRTTGQIFQYLIRSRETVTNFCKL
ncbi:alpha/beta hydrolase [Exilibacterium tricleocarpae]|uniref:Alpha/beta hydrolase n=1 Tax=Exilibacterium tricleocarpae TaxID=2591008 RepID=A0A545U9P6_9GAMM|nr:alpha/beta hydrolase [Exilibacterium tricleocarpae]TQV86192.1 alpha/beta hydrolase [Exilibacterium tricleocarpae]